MKLLYPLVLFVAACTARGGLMLQPVEANAPFEFGADQLDFGPHWVVDQSDLVIRYTSLSTDFDWYTTQIAGVPEGATGTHFEIAPSYHTGGHTSYWSPEEASPLVFELGGLFEIESLAFWSAPSGAMMSIELTASEDPDFSTSTALGTFVVANNTYTVLDEDGAARPVTPVQVFSFAATPARYVKLQPLGDFVSGFAIGEVAFETVPEPVSGALFLGAGLVLLSARRGRHHRG